MCRALYVALQRARGFNGPLDDEDANQTAGVWSVALRRIPEDRLRAVFETALGKYSNHSIPFGTPQMLDAWAEMTGGAPWTNDPLLSEMPRGWGCTSEDGHDYQPDGFEIAGWRYLECTRCRRRSVAPAGGN